MDLMRASSRRVWDGRWIVTPQAPGVNGTEAAGLEALPPGIRATIAGLVADMARPIDAHLIVPIPEGDHAELHVHGGPAQVQVEVVGAGGPVEAPFEPDLVAQLGDGRQTSLSEVAACVIDPDGRTSSVTPALATLLGRTESAIADVGLATLVAPDDADRVLGVLRGTQSSATGVRLRAGTDGTERWVSVRAFPLSMGLTPNPDPEPAPGGQLVLVNLLQDETASIARAALRADAAFAQAPAARARVSPTGTVLTANPAFGRLVDRDPAELVGHSVVDLLHGDDRAAVAALLGSALLGDLAGFEHEARLTPRLAEETRWVRVHVATVRVGDTDREADVELHDTTSRRAIEHGSKRTTEALRAAFLHVPTPMAIIDLDGTIREANTELHTLLDIGTDLDRPVDLVDLAHEDDALAVRTALTELASSPRGRVNVECRLRRADGTEGLVELAIALVPDSSGEVDSGVVQILDITARRVTEEKLLHQTLHDPLTGLGNRLLLRERLDRALATRHEIPFAVIFCDLDHFKWTNDSHGHEVGDALLVEVSRRLLRVVRAEDTVVRLGGDEFIVVATGVGDARGAEVLAEKVRTAIALPFTTGSHTLTTTASLGVVIAGDEHDGGDALLRGADLAMYRAKSGGRDRAEITDAAPHARPTDHITEALRLALDTDSLRLHHQPIIDLRTGRAAGTEVLVRVLDPIAGSRPPGRLLDGVNDPELLTEMATWVLSEVIDQLTSWDRAGLAPLNAWVNLTGVELAEEGIVDRFHEVLTRTRIKPERIHVEIPEPALIGSDTARLDALHALSDLGVRVGIDDFGTGSTSLTHLRSLPIQFLKIDPSIGRRLSEPGGRAVVDAIVAVGRALSIDVIADGISERSQMEVLAQLGCTHAQGDLFSPPTPADQLTLSSASPEHAPWR